MKDTVDRPGLKLAFAVARVRLKSTVGQQVSILPVLEWRYDNYQICLCTLAPSRAQLPVRRTFAWRIYSFYGVVWQPSCSAAKRRLCYDVSARATDAFLLAIPVLSANAGQIITAICTAAADFEKTDLEFLYWRQINGFLSAVFCKLFLTFSSF